MQKIIAHRIESLGHVPPSQTVYVFTHITVSDEYLDLARVGFEYIPQTALEAVRYGWTLNEATISMPELVDAAVHMHALGEDFDDDDPRGVRVTRGARNESAHGLWDLAESIINVDPRYISGCDAPE